MLWCFGGFDCCIFCYWCFWLDLDWFVSGWDLLLCLFLNYVMGVCDCLVCWVLSDCVDVDGIRGGLILDRFCLGV